MIKWLANSEEIEFQVIHHDSVVPPVLWDDPNLNPSYGHTILLLELHDNGQADQTEQSIKVVHEEITRLSTSEQELLTLPKRFTKTIQINSDNPLAYSDFSYDWGLFEHHLGKPIFGKRLGSIFQSEEGEEYIFSSEQLELLNQMDKFNQLPSSEKTTRRNYLEFSYIKKLAHQVGATLHQSLEQEQIVAPQKMQLKLESKPDEKLGILPEVESIDQSQFEKRFSKFRRVRNVYGLDDESGETTRLVFNDDQQVELDKILKKPVFEGEELNRLLESPESFFNPDIFDLDQFSERVLEIGLYQPKYTAFISPYKSEWIPGILVETSDEERIKLTVETPEQLQELKVSCQEAIEQKVSTVDWQGYPLPIKEAQQLIELAEVQLQDQSVPAKEKVSFDKYVLIIKENIDALEYVEEQVEKPDEFIHRFVEPPGLKPEFSLFPHQKEGVAWLQSLFLDGYSGGLLADDMGLGKTIQSLSFIKWHHTFHNHSGQPYLMVAPVSLLENWEREYKYFFHHNDLPVLRAYGQQLRQALGKDNLEQAKSVLQQPHIVMTTYETLRKKHIEFCAVDWATVVLDEAQRIKNPGTRVTNIAKALKADFKVCSTGTPVENTLIDIWCIMDFIAAGLLGSKKEFSKVYYKSNKDADTDVKSLGERLRHQIGIYIKRRLKKDVLDGLPAKKSLRFEKTMPSIQLSTYKALIEEAQKNKGNSDGNYIFKLLQDMRSASDHPYILTQQLQLCNVNELIETSAKLQVVCRLLKDIQQKDEKVLLFSGRRPTQHLLVKVLREMFNINSRIINGETPASSSQRTSKLSRQQIVDQFQQQSGFNALVMSPLAAGVGLNITAANHVIHYSREWNPAKEDQATDRVYRIGQTKEVKVYIPMAVTDEFKTFDVILDELLNQKRDLASASLFPTKKEQVQQTELFQSIVSVT